jgi:hypothetical protein
VLGREVGVGIAEQSPGSGYQFGVGVALAERHAAGRRSHRVDVRIVGKAGMGMMIEDGDLLDLGEEAAVDLGDVGAGKRAGLGMGGSRERKQQRYENKWKRSKLH